MNILLFILIFLFGSIIGSFLNVVILRLNTGRTIVSGRSMCMSCGRELRWFELIPIFSFIFQCGKCRRCKRKISYQYIIVEILTAVIFSFIFFKFLPFAYFFQNYFILNVFVYSFLSSILIIISVYDLRHKVIPDKLSIIFIISSFLSIFINSNPFGSLFVIPSWQLIVSGPLLALPFVLIWFFSKGRLMGLGDGKLVLGLGFMLGLLQGIFAVVFAFWVGAIVSLLVMFILKKKIKMKAQVPFAPFLIFATFLSFFFNLNVFDLIKIFTF